MDKNLKDVFADLCHLDSRNGESSKMLISEVKEGSKL